MTGPADPVDVVEALTLLATGVVAVPIERDLLVVSGPDAASYLQGQLSQDVEAMAVGSTARTLLLQPQGKIDAWLRVHRRDEQSFWLDTEAGYGAAASERLNRFKLRVDVTIEVVSASGLGLRGVEAPAAAERARSLVADGVAVLDATWGGVAGCDLVGCDLVGCDGAGSDGVGSDRSVDVGQLAGDLAVPLGPAAAAEAIRVAQGLPAMGSELDGSTIPAAAGIVDASVDFTKGCYVGQELVARIDSRGNNTPTRLHSLRFDPAIGPADVLGTELTLDGETVGQVTSAAPSPDGGLGGLGYLRRSVEAPATLSALAGRVTVEALPLPAGHLPEG